jgi:hypothetical protein
MDTTKFDAKRRLCPDGACIGIIGPNGRCTECGRAAGDAREITAAAEPSVDADSGDDLAATATGDGLAATATGDDAPVAASADSAFNPGRRLCDDGSCLGVIGPDGRCNVCGTKAA